MTLFPLFSERKIFENYMRILENNALILASDFEVFKAHLHSHSQTLRIFEGYPRQFSYPDAALILKNSQNSRTRILEV